MTILDEAYLATQTFGDRDLARELLGLFAEQCRRILPALSDPTVPAVDRADLAHTLKGSAAAIGADEVRRLSGACEAALRDAGEGGAALAALKPAIAAALAAIAARR